MAFVLVSGKPKVEYFPKTASTTLLANGVVALSSGQLIEATTSTTSHAGVVLRGSVSGDADFASTTSLPVMIPTPECVFAADVGSGTLTAALVGTTCDLASGGATIAASTNSHHQVTIVGVISSTLALVKINSAYEYVNAS